MWSWQIRRAQGQSFFGSYPPSLNLFMDPSFLLLSQLLGLLITLLFLSVSIQHLTAHHLKSPAFHFPFPFYLNQKRRLVHLSNDSYNLYVGLLTFVWICYTNQTHLQFADYKKVFFFGGD